MVGIPLRLLALLQTVFVMGLELFGAVDNPLSIQAVLLPFVEFRFHVEFAVLVESLIEPLLISVEIMRHRAWLAVGMPAGERPFEDAVLVGGVERFLAFAAPLDV